MFCNLCWWAQTQMTHAKFQTKIVNVDGKIDMPTLIFIWFAYLLYPFIVCPTKILRGLGQGRVQAPAPPAEAGRATLGAEKPVRGMNFKNSVPGPKFDADSENQLRLQKS